MSDHHAVGTAHRSRCRLRYSGLGGSDRPSAAVARAQSVLVESLIDDHDIDARAGCALLGSQIVHAEQSFGRRSIGEYRIRRLPHTPVIRRGEHQVGTAARKNMRLFRHRINDVVNHFAASPPAISGYAERHHNLRQLRRFQRSH